MRHDPAGAAIVVMLRGLKMYGMAQAADELMEQGAPAYDDSCPDPLATAQGRDCRAQVRSVAYRSRRRASPSTRT